MGMFVEKDKRGDTVVKTKNIFIAAGLVLVGLIALAILNPFFIVGATERGLRFSWGAIEQEIVQPGIHMKVPFAQSVQTVSILPVEQTYRIPVGQAGAITKDNQTIGADIVVFYRYQQENLVRMWKDFGTERIASLVRSGSEEAIKNVIGTFTIFTIAENQREIQNQSITLLRDRMKEYPVEITEFRVLNWDWSDDYDRQIQLTMQRAQEVRQKEQEVQIAQNEAQKQVVQAEASRQAAILQAEATRQSAVIQAQGEFDAAKLRADARAQQGRGERQYNEEIARTLDVQIRLRQLEIEMERVKKWNGQYVPTNNYGPIPVSTGTIQGSR